MVLSCKRLIMCHSQSTLHAYLSACMQQRQSGWTNIDDESRKLNLLTKSSLGTSEHYVKMQSHSYVT
jgi:hypothetical protein